MIPSLINSDRHPVTGPPDQHIYDINDTKTADKRRLVVINSQQRSDGRTVNHLCNIHVPKGIQ